MAADVGDLLALVDVHTRDQEELEPRRTLGGASGLSVLLTNVRSDSVHTNSAELAIKEILIFTLEKKRIFKWKSCLRHCSLHSDRHKHSFQYYE